MPLIAEKIILFCNASGAMLFKVSWQNAEGIASINISALFTAVAISLVNLILSNSNSTELK